MVCRRPLVREKRAEHDHYRRGLSPERPVHRVCRYRYRRRRRAAIEPGSKIIVYALYWGVADLVVRSGSRGFGVAEASSRAELLRSFGDRRAPFLVTDSVVQDQPDQATLSTGNGPDSLIMSETRDRTTINNFEDTSFSFYSGVSCLFE
jgi:hypothetical protein